MLRKLQFDMHVCKNDAVLGDHFPPKSPARHRFGDHFPPKSPIRRRFGDQVSHQISHVGPAHSFFLF
jgi:hypothetical protein